MKIIKRCSGNWNANCISNISIYSHDICIVKVIVITIIFLVTVLMEVITKVIVEMTILMILINIVIITIIISKMGNGVSFYFCYNVLAISVTLIVIIHRNNSSHCNIIVSSFASPKSKQPLP